MSVLLAESDDEILSCWPVLQQLRPHLAESDVLPQVRRQMSAGYQLAYVAVQDRPVAVAGYRVSENLAWGRFLYVDDLVTDEAHRSEGHGEELFAWLVSEARRQGCQELHLDSGVQRFGAHRFYLQQRMDITSHHFALKLD
jgi:GNAT superfamily N-acetyltransferase